MKKYVVWFHYNKPYSKRHGVHKWTVHWKGKCLIVNEIICNIHTHSKVNKKQPYVVMRGHATNVEVKDDIAFIS